MPDFTKLIKLLNLTASDQDGEALTALRMATKELKKLGLTWEQALARAGQPTHSASHGSGRDPMWEELRRRQQEEAFRQRTKPQPSASQFWGAGAHAQQEGRANAYSQSWANAEETLRRAQAQSKQDAQDLFKKWKNKADDGSNPTFYRGFIRNHKGNWFFPFNKVTAFFKDGWWSLTSGGNFGQMKFNSHSQAIDAFYQHEGII